MTTTATDLRLGRRLGAGGEAEVFEMPGRRGLAYKRYLQPSKDRLPKLRLMIDHPPTEVAGHRDHLSMAWPAEIVTDGGGRVAGFVMPIVDLAASVPVFQVYNPQSRRAVAPAFTWRYLLRTARNLAAIVDALHRSGYVIGDVNESNFLVTRNALVVLVDCDSLQVTDPADGTVHPCPVAKPEFTAPEFQSGVPSARRRTVESDDFSLAVLIHLLLLEGVHPFAGIWKGRGDPPDLGGRIAIGSSARRHWSRVVPPPAALSRRVLPRQLRLMVGAAFGSGLHHPSARPTARMWVDALDRAEADLRTCGRSPHHVFSSSRRRCPWCARIDLGLPDPFPGPTGQSDVARRPPPPWKVWPLRVRRRGRAWAASVGRASVAGARRLRHVARSPLGPSEPRVRPEWRAPVRPIAMAVVAGSVASLVPALTLTALVAVTAWCRSWRSAGRRLGGVAIATAVGLCALWSLGADGLTG
ncbi:MAG: hypothetical protein QOG03_1885, partial [Actinomycetota bacterium]|nr:hypothetical protein [Actinomycetota bacterium]